MAVLGTKVVCESSTTNASGITPPNKAGWTFNRWTDNVTASANPKLPAFNFAGTPIVSNKELYPVYELKDVYSDGTEMTSPKTFLKPATGFNLYAIEVHLGKMEYGEYDNWHIAGYYILRMPLLKINSSDNATKYYIFNPGTVKYRAEGSSEEENVANGNIVGSNTEPYYIRVTLNVSSSGVATFAVECNESGSTWHDCGFWQDVGFKFMQVDSSVTTV